MKKIIAIVALFASMAIAGAQQLGVTGGLTLSKMNGISNPKDTKAVALYSAGVLYKANLGAGFAIQPELLWQVKGANVQENVGALDNLTVSRSNNVELGLGLQWGPDLLAFRPYLFVEPFLGYRTRSWPMRISPKKRSSKRGTSSSTAWAAASVSRSPAISSSASSCSATWVPSTRRTSWVRTSTRTNT